MPVSANFYFQQADTVKQVPFNVEEEEPVKAAENPDTSTGKKESRPKTEQIKKKKAVVSGTSQKKIPPAPLPSLPDSIRLPVSALIKKTTPSVSPKAIIKKTENFDNSFSLFSGHLLKPASLEPKILVRTHQYWLSGAIVFSFFLFVIISAFYKKGLGRITAVFTGTRSVSQLYRGEYSLRSRTSLLLSCLFLLVISIFTYQSVSLLGLQDKIASSDLFAFLLIFVFLTIAYLVKIVFIRLSGYLFRMESIIKEYIFSLFIFNKMLGIVLLPVIVLFAFITMFPQQYVFIAGMCLISLALVARMLWIIYNGIAVPAISKYYLFLYLCTLEILPLLVLIKLIARKIL